MGVVLEVLQPGLAKEPPAMSLMSTAQVNLDRQPVDIHMKICKTSLLPYPYQATILCFSNSALFQQFLSVPYVQSRLLGALACLAVQNRYLLGLAVRSHTVPCSWCIGLTFHLIASLRAINSSFTADASSTSLVVRSTGVALVAAN